jgi:hypothetical protein
VVPLENKTEPEVRVGRVNLELKVFQSVLLKAPVVVVLA